MFVQRDKGMNVKKTYRTRQQSCNMIHLAISLDRNLLGSIADRSLLNYKLRQKCEKCRLQLFLLSIYGRTIKQFLQFLRCHLRENIIKIWAWENVVNKWTKVKKVKFEDARMFTSSLDRTNGFLSSWKRRFGNWIVSNVYKFFIYKPKKHNLWHFLVASYYASLGKSQTMQWH